MPKSRRTLIHRTGARPSRFPLRCRLLPREAPVVESVLGSTDSSGNTTAATIPQAVLPVDVALSPDRTTVALAAAGDGFSKLDAVYTFIQGTLVSSYAVGNTVIAVAYDGNGDLIAQTREPATLVFATAPNEAPIVLSNTTRADLGFDIFHTQAGGFPGVRVVPPRGRRRRPRVAARRNASPHPFASGAIAGTARITGLATRRRWGCSSTTCTRTG